MMRSYFSWSLHGCRVSRLCTNSCKRGRIFYLFALIAILILLLCASVYNNNVCITHQSYHETGKCHRNVDCCLRLEARVKQLLSIKAAIKDEIKVLSYTRFQLDHDVAKLKLLKHLPQMNGNSYNQDKPCQCKKDNNILKKTILHQRDQIALQNDLLANVQVPANVQHQLPYCKPININLTWKPEPTKNSLRDCNLQRCFQYDRCPINKIFNAYIYSYGNYSILNSRNLQSLPFVTRNTSNACLYVVIINSTAATQTDLQHYLHSLPSWHQYGKNHLLIDIGWTINNLLAVNIGYAMVAGANFAYQVPRMKFDIVIPPIQLYSKSHFMNPTLLHPQFSVSLQREYLLHFQGQAITNNSINQHLRAQLNSLSDIAKSTGIKVDIQTQCRNMNKLYHYHKFEWSLCVNSNNKVLQKSTFTIILLHNAPCISTSARLMQALVSGSIPVFITDYSIKIDLALILPFAEYVDWNLAGVILPSTRLPEVAKILISIPNSDIVKKRSKGQFFYRTYFSKSDKVLHATLALLRTRLQLPAYPINQYVKKHYPDKLTLARTININKANLLIPSLSYTGNFSTNWYNVWNNAPGPYWLYPFNTDNTLPTDSQFNGFGKGFQPINGGGTAFGKPFNKHLGGNYPLEQFTIVILTYNRPKILRQRLIHLSNILYLNKIVVVWNEYDKYAKTFQWPDFDVPIYIYKSKRNSLNDRFFPFDAIDTEAVLSLDDDVDLSADEIDFAFRIWRESRDRIVGFPARHHTWNNVVKKWSYDSNKTCQLSMVLTGAAFIHKHYLFLYTFTMSERIRRKVDDIMNCEDIAMNFLVSHITGKPPIKVTSRWNFSCPTCKNALTKDRDHFQKRNSCINYFVQVYGYMPLIFSQYRADSILYRTAVPNGQQKCYKLI